MFTAPQQTTLYLRNTPHGSGFMHTWGFAYQCAAQLLLPGPAASLRADGVPGPRISPHAPRNMFYSCHCRKTRANRGKWRSVTVTAAHPRFCFLSSKAWRSSSGLHSGHREKAPNGSLEDADKGQDE